MRTPLLLTATLILAVAFIYYAGNITPTDTPRLHANPTIAAPAPTAPLTLAQARQLTSQQRRALLKKALESYEGDKSDDYLCSLIAALTKDEINEASDIIRYFNTFDPIPNLEDTGSQDIARRMHSRILTGRIGETLTMQWGRVDPATWLETAKKSAVSTPTIQTALAVMNGWFESEPEAALAWAQTAQLNNYETYMAAHAITLSAAGDPQKLAASLLAFPAGDSRVKFCLRDYFDLTVKTTGQDDPAAIYENILTPLRAAAWGLTLERLTASNLHAAADWLTSHIYDPGRDYLAADTLIDRLVKVDPAGISKWAATFPEDRENSGAYHPAYAATFGWYDKDPIAAKAWLQTQPSILHWVDEMLKMLEAKENPKEPEADKTED